MILEARGTVTFDMLTDELDDIEQTFIRNHTLQNIPEPTRNYAVFDGWYYDIHCTEELNLYADVWTSDLTLYANWVNEDDGVPYTYVILDDGTVEIRSYTGHRRYITIPDKIENRIVSSIGDFAFQGQTRLREVNLPKYLKRIGLNAFADCNNLLSVSIPDGVETIGNSTFANDARLSEVTFGQNSSLKLIGDFAFQNCGLINFELPVGLSSVNGSAFSGCTRLKNYSVRKGNVSFLSVDGVLYNATESTVVAYPAGKTSKSYSLPDKTVSVGVYAFAYAKFESVSLNEVIVIGGCAFINSLLRSVSIPDCVTSIGKSAFRYNFNLSEVTLGKGIDTVPAGAFYMDYSLSAVSVPANVRYIMGDMEHGGAFEKCFALASVTFEENSQLVSIGAYAFAQASLQKIEIPATVVSIGSMAFYRNHYLASVLFGENSVLRAIGEKAFEKTYSLTAISLPANLNLIGDFAFMESDLQTVTVPKAVISLGTGAFASCHSLQNIFVEAGNETYVDVNGVVFDFAKTTLVEYPAGNPATSYIVPDGTKFIGDGAFYGSHNLTALHVTNGVETIGEYAFFDCQNVNSYALPDSLTAIERYAFSQNYSLSNVSVPDNVVQISNYAFALDYNLHYIDFTENSKLPRISFAAFAYTGIYSFRVPRNVSTIAQYAFEGCGSLQFVAFAANSKLDIIPAYMLVGANNVAHITFEKGSSLTSISAHGFEGMRNLVSVDFGDAKLTNIDNYAFRYCESLQTVNIPDGVKKIGRFAFYGAKSLTRLDLPTSVESIGRFAFYFAEKLNVYFKADVLPSSLQENWDYGIAGYYVGVTDVVESGDWVYAELTAGGVSLIKYKGSDLSLDLTALDLGGAIRQIGGYAFNYSKVTSVVLPATLESIQRYAFANSKLESVVIPAAVSFIGQYAFFNAPLTSVTFASGSSLAKIEQYAFAYTSALSSVSIPASVSELGSYAFYRSGITKVSFATDSQLVKINPHAFASSALTSVILPDSVNYIDDNAFRDCLSLQKVTFGSAENLQVHSNAFYNTAISSLYIPANMEYVGEYAFVGLENLGEYVVSDDNPRYKSINGVLYDKEGKKLIAFPAGKTGEFTVPEEVETIGFGAFENSRLESVSFESGINLLTLGYRAFYNSEFLTSVSVPASVVSIDYYAFAECRNLESVSFAEDNMLTGIYEGAFLNCISLKNITIPDSIVEISDYAFYGCISLTKLPVSETSQVKGIYDYAFAYTGLRELSVPDSVVDIGAYAFRGSRLQKVSVPDTQAEVLVIGIGAFQDCNDLEELSVPFSGESYDSDRVWFGYIFGAGAASANGMYVPSSIRKLSIGKTNEPDWDKNLGFLYDTDTSVNTLRNLEEFILPVGVENIGNWAFRNCARLTNVVIPDTVREIYSCVFQNCTGLTSIVIPDSVESIAIWAFGGCTGLTDIIIPDNVTRINGGVFEDCTGLTSVRMGSNVTDIDWDAFHNCTNLKNIDISDSVKSIGKWAFAGCVALKGLTIPDGVMSIGYAAFRFCTSLENITIPKSVKSIGDYAFSGCTGLMNVVIFDGVTSIGDSAFRDCSIIRKVIIPDSVTNIGRSVFLGCRGLTSVTIPNGVTSIPNEIFRNCTGLMSVTISNGITNIGDNAFLNCSNLYEVVNLSNLTLTIGSDSNGYVAYYARVIIDKDGNKTHKDENKQ